MPARTIRPTRKLPPAWAKRTMGCACSPCTWSSEAACRCATAVSGSMALECYSSMQSACNAAVVCSDAQRLPQLWLPAPRLMVRKLTSPQREGPFLAMQPRKHLLSSARSAICRAAERPTSVLEAERRMPVCTGKEVRDIGDTEHQARADKCTGSCRRRPDSPGSAGGVGNMRGESGWHRPRGRSSKPGKRPPVESAAAAAANSGRRSSGAAPESPASRAELSARFDQTLARLAAVPQRAALDRVGQVADSTHTRGARQVTLSDVQWRKPTCERSW